MIQKLKQTKARHIITTRKKPMLVTICIYHFIIWLDVIQTFSLTHFNHIYVYIYRPISTNFHLKLPPSPPVHPQITSPPSGSLDAGAIKLGAPVAEVWHTFALQIHRRADFAKMTRMECNNYIFHDLSSFWEWLMDMYMIKLQYVCQYIVRLWRGNRLLTRWWKSPLSHLKPLLFKKTCMYIYILYIYVMLLFDNYSHTNQGPSMVAARKVIKVFVPSPDFEAICRG